MILQGDCLEILPTLEAESVQCCVTSPPYFGLRDYGTATWEGGNAECDHKAPSRFDYPLNAGLGPTGVQTQSSNAASDQSAQYKDTCGKCGARRIDAQLGLEETPAAYVEKMAAVFREVRRVLKQDGTCWLNLGDSYAANRSYQVSDGKHLTHDFGGSNASKVPDGLKPKDLVGIPWRVAFALQADGWYLRQDIIWAKPNPMPESVTDRCTKAHEYIFLLSKSERYYYDAEAIAEKAEFRAWRPGRENHIAACPGGNNRYSNGPSGYPTNPSGRNRRSVWTISTEPYADAHFATFPTKIPKLCILAGSRPGDTVLDPFMGSGTTLMVALELGRKAVGIELNPEYCALAEKRMAPAKAQGLLPETV